MEVKFSTVWTNGKAQPGRSSDMERVRREKTRDEEDQMGRRCEERRYRRVERLESREKSRKVAKHRETGSKSRLAKAAGAEPAGPMSNEKWHAVVAQSTF